MSTLIEQAHSREWFYSYELPDGSSTSTYHDADIHVIHDTRWQMLQSYLDRNLGTDRIGLSALDLASHQGWFAVNMARAGFSPVLGIDARQSHVDDATLISNIYDMDQLSFEQGDIHEQSPD
jgi:tRNA (mo5U34)-methyltransferase